MRRSVAILLVVVVAPILVPRLSGIGYEEPANGAQAWIYVRQASLRVPELMSELTEEDFEQGGDEPKRAGAVLTAESLGPDSLSELLTALNQATTAFEALNARYSAAIREGKARQDEYDEMVQEAAGQVARAGREIDGANRAFEQEQQRLATEAEKRIEQLQDSMKGTKWAEQWRIGPEVDPSVRAQQMDAKRAAQLQVENTIARERVAFRARLRSSQVEGELAARARAQTYQALSSAAQAAHEQAENNRRYVAEAEAHLPVFAERQETCEGFYEDIRKRISLLAWEGPIVQEHPELRAKAVHPRYVVGNACVFAKRAQEPWLRRFAIEQLGYWKVFYPEARATLESIRNDESDALAAFAGEQLESK